MVGVISDNEKEQQLDPDPNPDKRLLRDVGLTPIFLASRFGSGLTLIRDF
jgi:hypothetical protein